MDEFTCAIDGHAVKFFLASSFDEPDVWIWYSTGTSEVLLDEVFKTIDLLNHDPPIPAVQAWLSSGQYGGMTLEEFLEQTQTEVTR